MSGVLETRSRYVRGLGHGAKLMAPSRSTRAAMEAELNRRNEENRHLRSQLEELRDEMRKSRVAMEAKIMKRTEELRIQQERQMQEMFQSLAARFQVLGCSTTPQTWGFPGDEIFEMEAEFCGADVSMEDLSSFLDRKGNGVDYSVFYDSDEDRYRVVTKMTQEKRKHNVSIEELDDSPHVAATTAHENIFRSAIPSDQPTPLDEPFFEEEVHEEPIQCEEPVQFDEAVWEAPVQGESVHEEAFKQKAPWETQKIRKSASTDVPRQRTW
ncbi:hypothetical protein QJS10_CPA09g00781 [Acorus calamus]|uniref:Uncharacterized protein n=1 Tax=Acorus calamus TaxID=4465 RepID=A0AAV9E8V6_ACOCL|nr:hypothetical protein QJS10_CPA09g00781 [Acorus calamus]